jgi:hypothetical protein
MDGVCAMEGCSAAALPGGGMEGQDGEAEAVSEGCLELYALELESLGEWEGIQPGRCGAAGSAEASGASTHTVLCAAVQ